MQGDILVLEITSVCMCVKERKGERERGGERERDREGEKERERESEREREREKERGREGGREGERERGREREREGERGRGRGREREIRICEEVTKITYWCLDKLHSLLSDALDDSRYVHHSLLLCPLQHMVDGDEGAAHTSTAQSTACIVRVC